MVRRSALADLHLVVTGDGELRDELRQRAESLGLSPRVHFTGIRRDVGNVLGAIDMFVMPSFWEGLPLALVHAMGAGLPVVASAVGGIPEVVVPGETGLLVPPADPGALAAALNRVLGDRDTARRMGLAGRRRVEGHFSWTSIAARTRRMYDELLEEKGRLRRPLSARGTAQPAGVAQ